jgi:hypothetical protein
MGLSPSKLGEVKLVHQEELLCATEPRFCLSTPTTLRLPQSIWWWALPHFQITDDSKDIMHFQCFREKTKGWPGKKALTDLAGIPIFFYKDKDTSTKYTFFRPVQENGTYPEICAYKAWDKGIVKKYKHTFEITDVLTKAKKKIVVRGLSKTIGRRECVIYYVGNEGKEIPVGKIYPENPDLRARNVDYMLEIAPGVDMALMLMATIPLHLEDPPLPEGRGRRRSDGGWDFGGDFGGGDGGGDGWD